MPSVTRNVTGDHAPIGGLAIPRAATPKVASARGDDQEYRSGGERGSGYEVPTRAEIQDGGDCREGPSPRSEQEAELRDPVSDGALIVTASALIPRILIAAAQERRRTCSLLADLSGYRVGRARRRRVGLHAGKTGGTGFPGVGGEVAAPAPHTLAGLESCLRFPSATVPSPDRPRPLTRRRRPRAQSRRARPHGCWAGDLGVRCVSRAQPT